MTRTRPLVRWTRACAPSAKRGSRRRAWPGAKAEGTPKGVPYGPLLFLVAFGRHLGTRRIVVQRLEHVAPRELLADAAHVVIHPCHFSDRLHQLVARVGNAVGV